MKYWGYLAAKLLIAVSVMQGAALAMIRFGPRSPLYYYGEFAIPLDVLRVLVSLVYWLIGAGLIFLAVLDQRYRCRTCLRRLRMPVATGSWNQMLLFGRPGTEYICPYGHGTLKVEEMQISGVERADWRPHEDMWKELASLEQGRR